MLGGSQQQRGEALAPDWALWSEFLAVNVSQAAALSLNVDPGRADEVTALALRQELQRRQLVISNHAENGGFRITGRDFDRRTKTRQPRFPLADFVSWALARSWALPEPLARMFAPPPAPAKAPAMMRDDALIVPLPPSGGFYSVDEWAEHLANAEYAVRPEPETEYRPVIAGVTVWRRGSPEPGLFYLSPKPGTAWHELGDVVEWEERAITDRLEVMSWEGYRRQAIDGAPPYPKPPTVLHDGSQVFMTHKGRTEWDEYWDDESANAITRAWWLEQMTKAIAANPQRLMACTPGKVAVKAGPVDPARTMVRLDHLKTWLADEQPFKSVVMADAPPAMTADPFATLNDLDPGPPAQAMRSVKQRQNLLDPLIDKAIKEAGCDDNAAVWLTLVGYASQSPPPRPLIEYTAGEGIKYQTEEADERGDLMAAFLSKDNLRDRLRRRRQASPARVNER